MSPEDSAASGDPHAAIADLKTWRRFIRALHPCEHRRGRLPRRRLLSLAREPSRRPSTTKVVLLDLSSQIQPVAEIAGSHLVHGLIGKASLAQPSPGSIAEAASRARTLSSPNPSRSDRRMADGEIRDRLDRVAAALWRFALRAHGPVGTTSPRHLSRRRFRSKLDMVSSPTCSRPHVGSAFVEEIKACSLYDTRTTGLPWGRSQPQAVAPISAAIASSRIIDGTFELPNRVSRCSLDPRFVKPRAPYRSHTQDSGIISQLSADYQWQG
ncbi:Hypothetical protein NGAL_HAMBI2605_63610 [Neorhizobium galegae bv. orientalis]|nr:Hypothetical protein NGAL_HAMBI2605_63610 [Neorhizobium galegae bv. orientalis]